MKRSTFIREAMPAAAVATMVGGGLLHSAKAESRKEPTNESAPNSNKKKDLEAARETLQTHDDAFNQQNLDALMKTFADSDDVILMGTGPGEHWVGPEAIRGAYAEMFKDFDKGTQTIEYKLRRGGISDDMAYLTTAMLVKSKKDGEPHEYVLNVSLVAEKIDGHWKIVSLHYSNLTGDEITTRES